jgi:hypothetical protein
MHRACIPVFVRGLRVLDGLLDKAEAHEAEAGLAPGALIGARLAPDMQTLGNQVQRASDTSRFSAERLTGLKAPVLPDTETSYAELKARIAATSEFLQTITPAHLVGSEERGIAEAGPDRRHPERDGLPAAVRPAELLLPRRHRPRHPAQQRRQDRQAGLSGGLFQLDSS